MMNYYYKTLVALNNIHFIKLSMESTTIRHDDRYQMFVQIEEMLLADLIHNGFPHKDNGSILYIESDDSVYSLTRDRYERIISGADDTKRDSDTNSWSVSKPRDVKPEKVFVDKDPVVSSNGIVHTSTVNNDAEEQDEYESLDAHTADTNEKASGIEKNAGKINPEAGNAATSEKSSNDDDVYEFMKNLEELPLGDNDSDVVHEDAVDPDVNADNSPSDEALISHSFEKTLQERLGFDLADHMSFNDMTFTYSIVDVSKGNDIFYKYIIYTAPISLEDGDVDILVWCKSLDENGRSRMALSERFKGRHSALVDMDECSFIIYGHMENGKYDVDFKLPKKYLEAGFSISYDTHNMNGSKGHIVVYDEGIAIHIIPLSSEMQPNGNAQFMYFIEKDGEEIIDDSIGNSDIPVEVNNSKYALRCKWQERTLYADIR